MVAAWPKKENTSQAARSRDRRGDDQVQPTLHSNPMRANGFELRVAAPSADTALKDEAYFVTIAATQTFNNVARSRYGGESRHREQDRGLHTGRPSRTCRRSPTARSTKFGVVLAFESSGCCWTDGPHSSAEAAGQRLGAFATFSGVCRVAGRIQPAVHEQQLEAGAGRSRMTDHTSAPPSAHTCGLEELRAGQHQHSILYQKIMAAHFLLRLESEYQDMR
jgi:hypothetical protein